MPNTKIEIQRALASGQFVPYFQPLINLRSGEIGGFEILARWQRARAGLVQPGAFIESIERFGFMNQLTASLLMQALVAVRTLPATFGLSINLSPLQLHDLDLPDMLARLADEEEFDLSRLTLELTESALVDDLNRAASVAERLKRLGVHLALDDFGTGYSSLLHLQALPFDELKIDISFVRNMVDSRQSRKITAAVCSLGMSLGMQTVAEGIESQEQARLLVWQGCTLGQGHLYGRAMPAADLPLALTQRFESDVNAELPASLADPMLSLESHPMARLSQLRAIYDSAPVGLGFVDQQMRYVNLNQKLAEPNKQSVQAHLGRTVKEMVAPELYEQFEPYLKRALRGESFPGIELTRAVPAGELPRTLLLTYHPVRDEAGEILGVCVAVSDVTILKRQEVALRESAEDYRHAVEHSAQIPWTIDPDGSNLTISPRWLSVSGITVGQSATDSWADSLHPDDQEHVRTALNRSLRTGEPLDVQFRTLDAEGAWAWRRSRGAPQRNEAGEIVRWCGVFESIEDQKRASEQLRRSEAELRAIFQATPAGVIVVDAGSRRILSANHRAADLLSTTLSAEMIWPPVNWELLDDCGRRIPLEHMPIARVIRTNAEVAPNDYYVRRPDGTGLWLNLSAAPIVIDQGRQVAVILILQDAAAGKEECARLLDLAYLLAPPPPPPRAEVTAIDSRRPLMEPAEQHAAALAEVLPFQAAASGG